MWRYQRVRLHPRPQVLVLLAAMLCLMVPLFGRTVLSHPDEPVNGSVPANADTPPDSQATLPQVIPLKEAQLPTAVDMTNNLPVPQPPPSVPQTGDCTDIPCVALSFDDGPDPASTPIILEALKQEDVKATFFVIGNRVINNGALVQRIAREGHDVGNHSWSHPDFTKLTSPQMAQQITDTQTAVTNLGVPAPFMFRPPYGAVNEAVRQQIPLAIVRWNVDPKDWAQTDPNVIAQTVEAQAKPGAIILMHDKPATAQAVDKIIVDLKTKYHLVPVSQLMHLGPGVRGEFIGR